MAPENTKPPSISIEIAHDTEDDVNRVIEEKLAQFIASEPQFQNLDIFRQARLENTIVGQFFGFRSYDDIEPSEHAGLIKQVARVKLKFNGIESSLDIHYAVHQETKVTFFEAMRIRPLT